MNETSRHARATDPTTSHDAAAGGPIRASHTEMLLLALVSSLAGLSAEEAAMEAGLYAPGVCWWRRIGELVTRGLAQPLRDERGLVTRISQAGRPVRIYTATPAGMARARYLEAN